MTTDTAPPPPMPSYDALQRMNSNQAATIHRLRGADKDRVLLGWSTVFLALCLIGTSVLHIRETRYPRECPRPVGMELPGFAPPHPVTASRAVWPQRYAVGQRIWRI